MKRLFLLFFIIILVFTTSIQANNTLNVTIESSIIHNNEETLVNNFDLHGIFIKNFINDEKILVLSNKGETIIEKLETKFTFKNKDFIIKEKNGEIYIHCLNKSDIFKKLEKNF